MCHFWGREKLMQNFERKTEGETPLWKPERRWSDE